MTPGSYKLLCPSLALAIMLGLAVESFTRPRPADADPYHRKIHQLSQNIPLNFNNWVGKDLEVYKSATKLLDPNFIIQRIFRDESRGLAATFLIVQCKDARDMGGHYPLNCYPTQGYVLIDSVDNSWTMPDGSVITGKTYKFTTSHGARMGLAPEDIIDVDSVMIVPDVGYVDTIDKVRAAAASLTRRFFGAAQVQVVLNDQIKPEDRAKITTEILQANQFIIQALRNTKSNGGSQ
jgi:hypothetical protein